MFCNSFSTQESNCWTRDTFWMKYSFNANWILSLGTNRMNLNFEYFLTRSTFFICAVFKSNIWTETNGMLLVEPLFWAQVCRCCRSSHSFLHSTSRCAQPPLPLPLPLPLPVADSLCPFSVSCLPPCVLSGNVWDSDSCSNSRAAFKGQMSSLERGVLIFLRETLSPAALSWD